MQPTFRTDLVATREEQDGVVTYRLEDSKTRASFRLYEIEFRIAQQLDGQRTPLQVAEKVKRDYNFEIGDADLLRFIEQLRAMNFIRADAGTESVGRGELLSFLGPSASVAPALTTASMSTLPSITSPTAAPEGRDDGKQPASPEDLAAGRHLLAQALVHLRGGELAHAHDFVLATLQRAPHIEHVRTLAERIDVLGGGATASEVNQLWRQCEAWYPEVVGTLGPMHQPQRLTDVDERAAGAVAAGGRRGGGARRLTVRILATGLVLAGAVAFWWLWNGAPAVHGRVLEAERLPIMAPGSAREKGYAQDAWILADRAGVVAHMAEVGQHVGERGVVLAFALPQVHRKVLDAAHAAVVVLQERAARLGETVAHEASQRQALSARHEAQARQLASVRPGGGGSGGGRALRRQVGRLAVQVRRAERRVLAAKGEVRRLEARLVRARQRQAALEVQLGPPTVRAPFSGNIVALNVKTGDAVRPGTSLVHLQDQSVLRLVFALDAGTPIQVGAQVWVTVEAGPPLAARVVAVASTTAHAPRAAVEVRGAPATFDRLPADAFHLIVRYVGPAFRVSSRALLRDPSRPAAYVLLAERGRIRHGKVRIEAEADGEAIVTAAEGTLGSRRVLLTRQDDGTPLSALREGAAVNVLMP